MLSALRTSLRLSAAIFGFNILIFPSRFGLPRFIRLFFRVSGSEQIREALLDLSCPPGSVSSAALFVDEPIDAPIQINE